MKKFIEFLKKAWVLIWSRDTLAHGCGAAALSLSFFVIFETPVWEFPLWLGPVAGAVLAMIGGLAFEFVQYVMVKGWTWEEAKKDLIRDAIGVLVSFIPMGIYLFN